LFPDDDDDDDDFMNAGDAEVTRAQCNNKLLDRVG
jgi:hypothetical protein